MKRPPKIEPFCRGDGQWSWRLRASNGKIRFTAGEGFHSRGNALRAARQLKAEFANATESELH